MAELIIPIGYYNYGITEDNYFVADTNDSTNWKELKIKLPKPELESESNWQISHYTNAPHQVVIHLFTPN